MLDKYKDFLSQAYNEYITTGDRHFSIWFKSAKEKKDFFDRCDYLEECGYIETLATASGFCNYKLTPNGITFAENDFKELENQPIVTQGSNSIYIQGSGNTVSDNYNQITIDINNSDLPPECKELINTFLYELKNPSLSKEKKIGKINQFLSDISSGTLSGVAASGLTTLLSTLFEHITL